MVVTVGSGARRGAHCVLCPCLVLCRVSAVCGGCVRVCVANSYHGNLQFGKS